MTIRSMISTEEEALAELADRMRSAALQERLRIQAERTEYDRERQGIPPYLTRSAWKYWTITYGLRAAGLYERGYYNYKDIQFRRNVVTLPSLPAAFDGLRILQLSDLHIDLDPSLTDIIIDSVSQADYDLCVITGDFRSETTGPYDVALSETIRLADQLHGQVYAVLGNHDFIEFVPPLEAAGIRFLLNETIAFQLDGAALYLSGIDDPHFYETDDLAYASQAIPTDGTSILLSHTPDVYSIAAAHDYDLMLSGHTHAGQICLPGGFAIQKNTSCPRQMLQGAWRFREMAGYTSAGTGSSGVPIRFFCPPEITIHELRTCLPTAPFGSDRKNLT